MDHKYQQPPSGGPPPAYTPFPSSPSPNNAGYIPEPIPSYQPNFIPPNFPANHLVANPVHGSSAILPSNQPGLPPNYGSTVILVNESVNRPLLVDENFVCPVCNIGLVQKEFTLLGLLLAIFLFPFGLLCLFILRKNKCTVCGASLGY